MGSGDDPASPVEVHVGQGQQVGRRRLPTVQHAPLIDVAILQKLIHLIWYKGDTVKFLISVSPKFSSNFDIICPS